jgi:hypothetical protein
MVTVALLLLIAANIGLIRFIKYVAKDFINIFYLILLNCKIFFNVMELKFSLSYPNGINAWSDNMTSKLRKCLDPEG